MAIDVDLILDNGQTVVGDGSTVPIQIEGGALAWAVLQLGALAGGTSLDVRIQQSVDLGANYYMAGKFQRLVPTDDNKLLKIPVYINRPTNPNNKTYVRVNYDDTGGGSWAIAKVYLDPMVSLAVNNMDEQGATGAAALVNAL